MLNLKEQWDKVPAKLQFALQIIVGILLAGGCVWFLYRSSDEEQSNLWALLVSFGLVLLVPRFLTTQTGDKLRVMHTSMFIALVVFIAIMVVVIIRSGHAFFN